LPAPRVRLTQMCFSPLPPPTFLQRIPGPWPLAYQA
jgi:hypothetical protein